MKKNIVKDIIEPLPIKGFREWLPEEKILEQRVIDVIRKEYELNGFIPIETPAVERNEILQSKGGFSTKEIYQLTRLAAEKNEKEKDRSFSLHFDLTVPFARYSAQHYGKLIFPFKRYQIQKVWRGEQPGKGRFREFYQADIDVIGNEHLSVSYDAEVLSVVNNVFSKLNIGEFVIRVNNRKLHYGLIHKYSLPSEDRINEFRACILEIIQTDAFDVAKRAKHLLTEKFSLDIEGREAGKIFSWINSGLTDEEMILHFKKFESERIIRHLDGIDKVEVDELHKDLTTKLGITSQVATELLDFARLEKSKLSQSDLLKYLKSFCDDPIYQEGVSELENLLEESYSLGVPKHRIALDPKIARGLDYYTGVIYETDLIADKEMGSVCSGGRFDNLADKFTKKRLPGVGISIGVSRLVHSIIENNLISVGSPTIAQVMIAIEDETVKHKMLQLANNIRQANIPCEVSFLRKTSKQMKYAAKKGFKYVIIASSQEISDGEVRLRNMEITNRDESEILISIDKLFSLLLDSSN